MHGILPTSLCQIEINVSDAAKSIEFYKNVLGWRPVSAELQEYIVLDVPENSGFGISLVPESIPKSAAGFLSRSTFYFVMQNEEAVRDILQKAPAFGGKSLPGPKELPGYGKIWQITDPDGQRIGLFLKAEKLTVSP